MNYTIIFGLIDDIDECYVMNVILCEHTWGEKITLLISYKFIITNITNKMLF